MLYKRLSVLMAVLMTVSLILSACATPAPEVIEKVVTQVVTQVVKETVKETVIVEGTPQVVEKEVTKVVEVEKEVTKIVEVEKEVTRLVEEMEQPPVVVLQGVEVHSLDPLKAHQIPDSNANLHHFDPLIRWDEDMNLVTSIATEWKMVDDLTWEFKIREGVKAHNGEVVDANDVAYSFDRVADPEIGALGTPAWVFGNIKYDRAEVIDDNTVHIKTQVPIPDFPEWMISVFIFPEEYYSSTPLEELARKPIGTGPYKFVEWIRGERLVMEANEDYWGGVPEVKRLVWRPVPEASARIAELNTGGADIIVNVPPDLGSQIDPAYGRLVTVEGLRKMYVGFVFYGHPAMQDKRVRQAFNYGLDFQKIIDSVLRGNGQRTFTFANRPNQHPDLEPYPFDPEKALELMKEAGYEDQDGDGILEGPDGQPLKLTMQTPKARYVKDVELSQAIAADLKQNIGADIEVEVTDTSILFEQLPVGKLTSDLFFLGSGTGYTCTGDLSDFYGGANWYAGGWFTSESGIKFDAMFEEAISIVDPEQRTQACYDLQEYMYEEVPLIFLYFQVDYYGVSNRLDWEPEPNERIIINKAKFK